MIGPEPRMSIFEMSVRLGIEFSCQQSITSVTKILISLRGRVPVPLRLSQRLRSPISIPATDNRSPATALPLFHHLHEIFEQVVGVVGSGAGFRVILHG